MTPAPFASSASAPDRPGGRAVVWTAALAGMLVPLNSTMIAVALPRLVDDLHASLRSVTLLVTAYLVAMAALQPVAGRLGDRFGRRPLLLGGLAWFAAASAGAAVAGGLEVLVVFRVQQAIAGALIALLALLLPSAKYKAEFSVALAPNTTDAGAYGNLVDALDRRSIPSTLAEVINSPVVKDAAATESGVSRDGLTIDAVLVRVIHANAR